MSILNRFFKSDIEKIVQERVAIDKVQMDERILKTESEMVEVSERRAQEKAQELFERYKEELSKSKPEDTEPKSYQFDPMQLVESMGYKERIMSMSYDTLRLMSERNPVVAAVINTRIHQVTSFSGPPRSKYDVGFEIVMREEEKKPSSSDMKVMKELGDMIESTGRPDVVEEESRDSFDAFLSKSVRDSLTYDQHSFEMVNGRNSTPVAFYAVDAATIRLATTPRILSRVAGYGTSQMKEMWKREMLAQQQQSPETRRPKPEDVRYVQVIGGRVMNTYSEKELAFGVRNPRTAIQHNGYGVSELEILISVITSHLWAEEYNKRFFCVFVNDFIELKDGLKPISEVLGKDVTIWNGRKWCSARVVETGLKPVVRTKLWNGIELRTSPEHRFLILPKTGVQPIWKRQEELSTGDYALLGCNDCSSVMDYSALKVGKKYDYELCPEKVHQYRRKKGVCVKSYARRSTHRSGKKYSTWFPSESIVNDSAFWEMVGFALGDGYWSDTCLIIFPHPTKEKDILERFSSVCNRHDLDSEVSISNPSYIRVTDGGCGYPYLYIRHGGFLKWLYDLGFQRSSDRKRGRCIPYIFFSLPSWIRCALLRGLFSADGCNEGYENAGTPCVGIHDPDFRQDVLRCLWSVGVASNEQGSGWNRGGNIRVQDVKAFADRIGFLQTNSQSGKSKDNLKRTSRVAGKWDKVPTFLAKYLVGEIRKNPNFSTDGSNQWSKKKKILNEKDRWMLDYVYFGGGTISRPRLKEIMVKLGMELPWYLSYIFVPIDVIDREPIGMVPMGDVEVFDDEHTFLANFVAVHNSSGAAPKGIIHFEGTGQMGVSQEQLLAFRRQWHAQVAGVWNSWKTPIISTPAKLQYTNLQMSNRQMEFTNWIEYLIKLICAIYLMDPAEINFDLKGAAGQQAPMFESPSEAKLKMSRDRGLKPLLRHFESEINKNIIFQIDPRFEFQFVGLDSKSEKEIQELRVKELERFKTVDEVRTEYDMKGIGDEKGGDLIMDSSYINFRLQKMQQEAMGGMGGGAPGGAPEPDFGTEEGAPEEEEGPEPTGKFGELDRTLGRMGAEKGVAEGEEKESPKGKIRDLDQMIANLQSSRR
jgi:hypothetical protein